MVRKRSSRAARKKSYAWWNNRGLFDKFITGLLDFEIQSEGKEGVSVDFSDRSPAQEAQYARLRVEICKGESHVSLLRFSNEYGPEDDDERLIDIFSAKPSDVYVVYSGDEPAEIAKHHGLIRVSTRRLIDFFHKRIWWRCWYCDLCEEQV